MRGLSPANRRRSARLFGALVAVWLAAAAQPALADEQIAPGSTADRNVQTLIRLYADAGDEAGRLRAVRWHGLQLSSTFRALTISSSNTSAAAGTGPMAMATPSRVWPTGAMATR